MIKSLFSHVLPSGIRFSIFGIIQKNSHKTLFTVKLGAKSGSKKSVQDLTLYRLFNCVTIFFFNVPFALVGGILALWASGSYLSVPASVGFIALLGIAVLNGLVLVSHFNQLIDAGRPLAEAVFEGAVRRLRPVLMTATIAACGLVPLLFASGPGSEIQKPLAIVVIGGLITSTALTLVLLPILFRRFGVARTTTATTMERPAWISPFAS